MVDAYMNNIATRSIPVEALAGFKSAFSGYVAATEAENFGWNARQTLHCSWCGTCCRCRARSGCNSNGGFNPAALDQILGLSDKNLGSVTILALGYRDAENDMYAGLSKVRKSTQDLFVKP